MKLQLPRESEFYLETHDPDVTSLITRRIAQGESVIEVGAHIGYFSLLICKMIGATGKLFALEALPSNYQRLCEHLAENGFDSRARVFSLAGSAEDGTATLLEFEHSTIARLASAETLVQDKPTDQRVVACRSLDSLVEAGEVDKPTFVKIDVEGAEYDVILGMRSVIDRYRPELLIEMHNERVGRQVTDFLTGQGYLVYRGDGPTLSLLDQAASAFTGLNLLFVPRERIYSS